MTPPAALVLLTCSLPWSLPPASIGRAYPAVAAEVTVPRPAVPRVADLFLSQDGVAPGVS